MSNKWLGEWTAKSARHTYRTLAIAASVALGLAAPGSALAQAQAPFPSKPIRIALPGAPGSGADTILRLMIPSMEKALGQPILLDNRAGGGGMLAAGSVAGQPADGHTLMIGYISTMTISPVIEKELPYNAEKDFVAISHLFDVNLIVDARKDFPANNLKELAELAKKSPGKISFGHSGNFGAPHIGMELFKKAAGVDMLSVPYRGEPPAMTALLGKETDIAMVTMAGLASHLKEGTVKVIGQLGTKRSPLLPDVPTATELGYPSVVAYSWVGAFAPTGTPKPIVDRWAQLFRDGLNQPEVLERLKMIDYLPNGDGPEEFSKFVAAETIKWKDLILGAGLNNLPR